MSSSYIVTLKSSATEDDIKKAAQDITENGGEVIRTFNSVILKGLAAKIPDSYLDNFKSLNGDVVDFVEPDQQVHTQ
ncbi:hypothetical protein SISSUDRAFT_1126460 [Sistotremastrum suecicum HHB10207 ss-3]|uniref:Inhibitor I9 domain-containing protein n=1 Tax=Sistotremastrum suecicum HHB10207 ss-3 TaxID=1314776 RepID=A0A166GB26_9AGAM|nr:hypothetical protein SISSUDRAFT_1126460 [Sistotremastrum suecicum HHB10207 ss-3]